MVLEGLQDVAVSIGEGITTFVTEKPLQTVAIGATAVGVGALGAVAVARKRRKATRVRKVRTRKGRSRDRKFRSKQKHELAYVKRKRKAGKKITRPRYKTKSKKRVGKIYYTKRGQPYKILSSGKARFIKGKRR